MRFYDKYLLNLLVKVLIQKSCVKFNAVSLPKRFMFPSKRRRSEAKVFVIIIIIIVTFQNFQGKILKEKYCMIKKRIDLQLVTAPAPLV